MVLALGEGLKAWFKPVLFTFFIALIVGIPLLFITPGEAVVAVEGWLQVTLEGVWLMASLVLRATAAAAVFTGVLMHIGWRGVVDGLYRLRLPQELALMVGFFTKYIPVFLRDACRMMAARESRLISSSYTAAWKGLATMIGEMLLRGYWRSMRLSMALRARGFSEPVARECRYELGMGDTLILAVLLLVSLTQVLGGW